jgi:hypothetical protein
VFRELGTDAEEDFPALAPEDDEVCDGHGGGWLFGFGLGPLWAGRLGFLFWQQGSDDEEFWHELEGDDFSDEVFCGLVEGVVFGLEVFFLGRPLACFGVFHVNGPLRGGGFHPMRRLISARVSGGRCDVFEGGSELVGGGCGVGGWLGGDRSGLFAVVDFEPAGWSSVGCGEGVVVLAGVWSWVAGSGR